MIAFIIHIIQRLGKEIMNNKKLKYLIQAATFSLIITILSMLSLPMKTDIPITLQTFGVALCGFLLGPVQALLAVLIYILAEIIGLPVFANLQGGFHILSGSAGGFIIGFIPMVLFCGFGKLIKINKLNNLSSIFKLILALFLAIGGLTVYHILSSWQYALLNRKTITEVLPVTLYPFIIKDILSVIFAYFLAYFINNGNSET